MKKKKTPLVRFFFFLALICALAEAYFFLDTYYLRSYRTVHNFRDPRWRVFDYHSRPAPPGEIYNVSDIPAIRKVREAGRRRLRFEFTPPPPAANWKTLDAADRSLLSQGPFPEIQFPDAPGDISVVLVPDGIRIPVEIRMTINFYPGEKYKEKGLSWGDNYWIKSSSVPFTTTRHYSVDEWTGFRPDDPEIAEARRIMGTLLEGASSAIEKSERVFRFVMDKMKNAGGTPSDRVQASSPLETYKLFTAGKGKGFCENKALVYYLFANAAGVKTRLVDVAGRFGPLKLTGHYFCESWLPETNAWAYVDPQANTALVTDPRGKPVHTLGLKRLFDLDALSNCAVRRYDDKSGEITTIPGSEYPAGLSDYLSGYPVIAYKFGYGNTAGFSKIKNFLHYPTLLYAEFTIPPLHFVRAALFYGFFAFLGLAVVSWFLSRFGGRGGSRF
ncbi:MAG: transglutaminase-like domain-containing protein [Acidobacteriota bacterium]|nr:transglutaminase-like domain-containing protein [Acidobacteriota bacterium]